MATYTTPLTDALHRYMVSVSVRESDVLAALRAATAPLAGAHMQVAPEIGQFLTFLARLVGARRALELGTFTGYSAICLAQGLLPNGDLVACDMNAATNAVARDFFARAGVADRIRLDERPALTLLADLRARGEIFDIMFIDAMKGEYIDYLEGALPLLSPHGVMVFDNTFMHGEVVHDTPANAAARAIRAFNAHAFKRTDIDLTLLPFGDGLTLIRKSIPPC